MILQLQPSDMQIIELLCAGRKEVEIAGMLKLDPGTVTMRARRAMLGNGCKTKLQLCYEVGKRDGKRERGESK